MSNVKISPKGKALLQRGYSSAKIANAIVKEGNSVSNKEGITVKFDNHSVVIRSASSSSASTKKQ
jgi:hypothetical protein